MNPSIFDIDYFNSELQIKVEEIDEGHLMQESSTSISDQDIFNCKINVDNYDDSKSFEIKLEPLVIKDELNEVTEGTSTLEIIKCEANFPTQKAFVESITLKKHKLSSKTQKLFKCDKTFRTNFLLKRHNCKKTFKCKICDETFSENGNRNAHTLSHKGEKPFRCNVCDKPFAAKITLRRHILGHNEKPFKCNQSDKVFICSKYLKSHLLLHKGERLFKCNQCDKAFICNKYLKSHLLLHKGNKSFKCDICDREFSQKRSLETHINS